MDQFRIPGWYQRVFWFWMGVLSPVDMDAIDVERAIRSTTVPVLIGNYKVLKNLHLFIFCLAHTQC